MTLTGSIMGTAQYLSPEQAQGHAVTATSDLYAVGVVLYELLTGAVPFDGETAVSIALKQVSAEPPAPSALNPRVGPALDAVVRRALAKDPAQRFADAEEFIAALERARTEAPPAKALANGPLPIGPPPPSGLLLAPAGAADGEHEHRDRTRRWWWVAAGVLALALAAGALVLLLSGGKVTVPNVIGQTQGVAVARLQRAGLAAVASQGASATVPSGLVIDQGPRAGTHVKKGARVSILVSSGPGTLALPGVVGLTGTEAVARLQAAGLRPTVQTKASSKVPHGRVISTNPTAGTELQVGSPVSVAVSGGPAQTNVPNVTGSSQDDATTALTAAGLKVGTITRQISTEQSPGIVLSQSPTAGTVLKPGSQVDLVVAQAPKNVAVPAVVGKNETQAAAALGRAGFEVKSVSRTVSEPAQAGVVLKQSPAGGQSAPKGATVTITVGTLEATTPTTPTTTTTTTSSTPAAAANPATPVP
jgi:serine/threonine-protein kinase